MPSEITFQLGSVPFDRKVKKHCIRRVWIDLNARGIFIIVIPVVVYTHGVFLISLNSSQLYVLVIYYDKCKNSIGPIHVWKI